MLLNGVNEFFRQLNYGCEKMDENSIDNSRLEKLMMKEITPQMQRKVLEILKESQLFMPVDFGPSAFEGLENAKPGDVVEGPKGFSILYLTDNNGNRAVPLFTSDEMLERAGAPKSVMAIYMSDLADMLKQTDKYSVIAINPFTENGLNMPVGALLSQFRDETAIEDIRNDEVKRLLDEKDGTEKLAEGLLASVMIVPCVVAEDGTNFVLIRDGDSNPHLPLFTDIDEFKKMFDDYSEDVFAQAYHFTDLLKVARESLVINPASHSLVIDHEMFKK